ncbi:hypothetical protein L226DRAFT_566111 [Lentinus tigrinus ALCF2SS1-7]|uniref:Uncharacterized protein n=1 Tax=Lentinus tigrinus ALCF2SS1-6 TaxID=1328759 RepID=A0A5C2T6N0_9APHY|nr:hypothetical protein L227DRAFT_605774 [Lentinus tigrinus ALCF2SS1-6]RPD81328.1 hypothetical protein L226DRAFT_566111 [Lentinus tigrinus ALCF2SS1-7]
MASPPKRSDTVSSSSSRPASPSPARSFRNRLTSAARRASTGLSFSQVGKLSRSSSKNSLKLDTAQAQTPPPEDAHVVSPVAESPAREAAANSEDAPVGPSPLANVAATAESPSEPALPIPLTTSPEQVPIPLPSQAPATAPEPLGFKDPIPTTAPVPEPIVVVSSPDIVPQDAPAPAEPEAALPEPTPQPTLPPPAAEPPVPSVIEDNRADYFSYSDPVVPTVASIAEPAPVVQPAPVFEPAPAEPQAAAPPPPVSHVAIPSDESTFAWSVEPALGHKASRSSFSEPTRHAFEPSAQSGNLSSKASKSSLTSSYGQLISDQTRGRSSSVRFSDDPFADQYAAEVQTTSMPSVETVTMPE